MCGPTGDGGPADDDLRDDDLRTMEPAGRWSRVTKACVVPARQNKTARSRERA